MKFGLILFTLGLALPAVLMAQAPPPINSGAVNWPTAAVSIATIISGAGVTLIPVLLKHSREMAQIKADRERDGKQIDRLNGFARRSIEWHDAGEKDRVDLRRRQDALEIQAEATSLVAIAQDPEGYALVTEVVQKMRRSSDEIATAPATIPPTS